MQTNTLTNAHINVHHLTRVEGHGNIVVDIKNGIMQKCDLEIVEAPRFFEPMLRGVPYQQASHITSRICGICAVTHATASLRAVEKALGVEISPQTELLRMLNLHGEMLDSHTLHVYMLVAPDLFGAGSVIPLARSAPEVVVRALRMKKLAGDMCAIICGRHTHPIALTVGGFKHLPTTNQLVELGKRLEAVREDVDETVELFQSLSLPEFERETEYMALSKPDKYCLLDGEIASSDGGMWQIEDYKQVTNEHLIAHSTAKHTRNQRKSYMVGALARFNVNYDRLHPMAKAAAEVLDLTPKCTNPYLNTIAQIVEIVHSVEESLQIIHKLVENGIEAEKPAAPARITGEGVGACEAPRGTLYHHYAIKNGVISDANCIIPTGQNLANIEADMRQLTPTLIHLDKEQITHNLEMLVRAYDPCISCSTHMLEVKFV